MKGATRWITIGPLNLQPSEFAKPLFAIVCAWLLSLWREGEDFPGWAWATGLAGVIVAILILQPDIGMTAVIALTWGFQMFLAGMPLLLVIIAVALAPLALILAYYNLSHVQARIDKFFDGGSMQSDLSIRSFADGGLLGVGPGDGKIKVISSRCSCRFYLLCCGRGIWLACLSSDYRTIRLYGLARL